MAFIVELNSNYHLKDVDLRNVYLNDDYGLFVSGEDISYKLGSGLTTPELIMNFG